MHFTPDYCYSNKIRVELKLLGSEVRSTLMKYRYAVSHIYIQVKKKAFKINAKIEDVGLKED